MTEDLPTADPSRAPSLDDPDTAPFWAAAAERRLSYPTCDACGAVVFYPRGHCPRCLGRELTWHDSAGEGVVYSRTVVRNSRDPVFRDLAPYVIALVDLAEGFRMFSHVVGSPPEEVAVGARVVLAWQPCGPTNLPVFRLRDAGGDG